MKRRVSFCCLVVSALAACQGPTAEVDATKEERIGRIENAFGPVTLAAGESPVKLNLRQLMDACNVHGLSIAVVENYQIAWAKGYGVTETGGKTAITPRTLFQAGSVSKPIATLAALALVEQGKLTLDEDVNNKLRSWKVPDNQYTKEQKVTLRRILTHTAGTTLSGVPGYKVGQSLPTLVQLLDGEKPAYRMPVRIDTMPGSRQRYSGGGFTIMQQLLIDVTGKPFPRVMHETVFEKLGLEDSTFEQPLPAQRAPAVACGHKENGEIMPGKWEILLHMAAAGLWTTPTDLAKIGIEVALAKQGKSHRVLSTEMARQMLSVQTDPAVNRTGVVHGWRMGLGWNLGDQSDSGRFEHNGDDPGYFARFVMWDSGHGAVVMANSDSRYVSWFTCYVLNNIANEYGWGYQATTAAWPPAEITLLVTAKLRGPHAAIQRFRELRELSSKRGTKSTPTILWASPNDQSAASEWDLWGLAKAVSDAAHLRDGIEILNAEIQEYPKYWRAYHTLGDLYARAGDKDRAIQNYEKSIELYPQNKQAIQILKTLKGQTSSP
jgi:CubicO group peptidase (beta-lactamase class C family)